MRECGFQESALRPCERKQPYQPLSDRVSIHNPGAPQEHLEREYNFFSNIFGVPKLYLDASDIFLCIPQKPSPDTVVSTHQIFHRFSCGRAKRNKTIMDTSLGSDYRES